MKVFFKIVLTVFLIFVLIAGGGMFYISRGLKAGENVVVKEITPAGLADGTYNGKYKAGRWTNEIMITVKGGKLTAIDIVDDVTIPKPEWTKELFERVIKNQSTKVDVVSGATITCKAYLKSVEDALTNKVVKK
jgi:uncharacterized protein with FMN-binding domain